MSQMLLQFLCCFNVALCKTSQHFMQLSRLSLSAATAMGWCMQCYQVMKYYGSVTEGVFRVI